jgi:hypothetical protein
MVSLDPRKIVSDVMGRRDAAKRTNKRKWGKNKSERDAVVAGIAPLTKRLSRQPVSEVIHFIADRPIVTMNPLMIPERGRRSIGKFEAPSKCHSDNSSAYISIGGR